ncbi:MAG TPA: PA14 domain-containing protein [Planctomycetota bacterium]|nr:PA14 domain-containing protein [Planctomycetota bacterium]
MGKGLKSGGSVGVVLWGLLAWSADAHALQGLEGRYYNNSGTGGSPPPPPGSPAGTTFTGTPALTRVDATINFGFSNPPGPGVQADDFMVAWTGFLRINTGGNYTFNARSDDGVRLWIDGNLIVDSWVDQGPTDHFSGAVALTAGAHTIRLEFYENGGGEECRLSYNGPDSNNQMIIIPSSALSPVPPVPPDAPTNVQATAVTSTITGLPSITVTWDAVADATSYQVFRTDQSNAPLATVTGTSYQDTAVSFGVQYCYFVRAVNAYGTSGDSNVACATPQPLPPRTGDHEEGFMDGRCSCGSSVRAALGPAGAAGAGVLGAALLAVRRRRRSA